MVNRNHNLSWLNLILNPFPRRKRNRIYADREQSSALRATLRLTPGAGVTPAEGGVEPTAGSTFDDDDRIDALSLLHPSRLLCTVGEDSLHGCCA